jgi:hypothetical protein
MYKFILPKTKEYREKKVLPLRVRWHFNDNKTEFFTGLRIRVSNWDEKRMLIKPRSEKSVRIKFFELEDKAETLWQRLQLGEVDFADLKRFWHGTETPITSVDEFAANCLGHLKDSTLASRKNAIRTYKKHLFGASDRVLETNDISPSNCLMIKSIMIKKGLSQETVNSCLRGVKATYNDMYYQKVEGITSRLILPRGTIVKTKPVIPSILTPKEYLIAITKIRTVHDWQSMALGYIMFALRGLDLIDVFKISKECFQSPLAFDKVLDKLSTGYPTGPNNIRLKISRSKVPFVQPMDISISNHHSNGFIPIFQILRTSLSATNPTISSLNIYSLSSLGNSFDFEIYRKLSISFGKKHKKLAGSPYKAIRKTFRTLASIHCRVSTEIGNALLGQENSNISSNYISMKELSTEVDEVHEVVLSNFQMDKIFNELIIKAEELGIKDI